jgi:hypothetical protein
VPDHVTAANMTVCRATPPAYGRVIRFTIRLDSASIAVTIRFRVAAKTPSSLGNFNGFSEQPRAIWAQTPPLPLPKALTRMNPTIRIVTRGSNGELRTKDYEKHDTVLKMHTQIGIDDCSTDLSLRGMPVFRGLIGPMPEGKGVVRYETPEVFETLTKEWTAVNTSRSRRRRTTSN